MKPQSKFVNLSMLWLFLGSHIVWSNFDWVSNGIAVFVLYFALWLGLWIVTSVTFIKSANQCSFKLCLIVHLVAVWTLIYFRCRTITNNYLVVRVFPRFRQFDYLYCAFSLALWVFSFLFIFFFFFLFFFPHVSRAQSLAPARTRTRVVRLGAQCTDHWTTGQSRGVSVPAAWWVAAILYSYGATLCEIRYYFVVPCEFCQP